MVDPIECSSCRKLICRGCKDDGDKECPSADCKDIKFVDANPFTIRHLESQRFICKNIDLGCCFSGGSAFGVPYKRALTHLKKCKSETYLCPFKCIDEITGTTTEIVGEFMNDHLEECDNFKVKCKVCGVPFAIDQLDKHDCFEELKK